MIAVLAYLTIGCAGICLSVILLTFSGIAVKLESLLELQCGSLMVPLLQTWFIALVGAAVFGTILSLCVLLG